MTKMVHFQLTVFCVQKMAACFMANPKLKISVVLAQLCLVFLISQVYSSKKDNGETTSLFLPDINLKILKICPRKPPFLSGPIKVSTSAVTLSDVQKALERSKLKVGGKFHPLNCQPRHKVALIVPYRDRQSQLAIFLNHIHPFLQRQQLAYAIFVIEQAGNHKFNGGMLKNIGFMEAMRNEYFECVIFHDIDLLPENDFNMYTCADSPRHIAGLIDQFDYRKIPEFYFGGVVAFSSADFIKVNGYSNQFWGWGGEGDNLRFRVGYHNMTILRDLTDSARYKALPHKKTDLENENWQILEQDIALSKYDGLSTLTYKVLRKEIHLLYTHVTVEIREIL